MNGFIPKVPATNAEAIEFDDIADTIDWGKNFEGDAWRDNPEDVDWRSHRHGVEWRKGIYMVDWRKSLATFQRVK